MHALPDCRPLAGYANTPKRHTDCRDVQVEAFQSLTCEDAMKAVGVSQLVKPQLLLTKIPANQRICAVARCPEGGYLTGTSISAWPPTDIVPVVTYTHAAPILAATPDTEQKATKVMGMWQLLNANLPVYAEWPLTAYCQVCGENGSDGDRSGD